MDKWAQIKLSQMGGKQIQVTPDDIDRLSKIIELNLGRQGSAGFDMSILGQNAGPVQDLIQKVDAAGGLPANFAQLSKDIVAVADLRGYSSIGAGGALGAAVPDLAKEIRKRVSLEQEKKTARKWESMSEEDRKQVLDTIKSNPQYVLYPSGEGMFFIHDKTKEQQILSSPSAAVIFVDPARIVSDAANIENTYKSKYNFNLRGRSVVMAIASVIVHELVHQSLGGGEPEAEASEKKFMQVALNVMQKNQEIGFDNMPKQGVPQGNNKENKNLENIQAWSPIILNRIS